MSVESRLRAVWAVVVEKILQDLLAAFLLPLSLSLRVATAPGEPQTSVGGKKAVGPGDVATPALVEGNVVVCVKPNSA